MNPREQSDLVPYAFKVFKQQREQMTSVVNSGKRLKLLIFLVMQGKYLF